MTTTSIFDPVLTELSYRWFNIEGGRILDPVSYTHLDVYKRQVYISGQITGLPVAEYVEKFSKADAELKAKGYEVVNPLR